MPKISPFKAVRPTRDKAALVTSRSYDDYSAAELASQLDFNPFSFLHVLHPGYVNVQKNDPVRRFGQVKAKYLDFKHEGVLKSESDPIFYLYEMRSKSRTYTGIVAGISIQDYLDGKIRKHEDTLEYRVEQFEEYLHITGFNTEPVLIAYPENEKLYNWISLAKKHRPLYLFSSPNRDRHTLWRIRDKSQIDFLVSEFDEIPALYIADGHHRSASAALLFERYKDSGNDKLSNFMALLVSENEVRINEYNRVIRDLNGLSDSDFLSKIKTAFDLEDLGQELWKPTKKGEFGMYFRHKFYRLSTKTTASDVDAQFLYDEVLAPILEIGDLRNDGRIEYLPGNQPLTKLVELVDSEEFEVGFTLFPIAFEQIRKLADAGEILPPKSTYIEPKIRSGLVIYEL
ncbi:DUF1015 domain-containing protein [Flavobacterium sp.]|uniref:DUF1015 domain-containing protein n=1 Tax=Flavobacterium sp. TaxID=239 RepID=UPI0012055365|nr:DUF1015 domain-containing protein [Flavobacterium sp.]RZJ70223.1 MAG: DUF1015 domain-containing protein [Flavobacterium sp.]